MSSLISVVIPAYNAEKTLASSLDSVLKQTLLPEEIIIIDDQSHDQTQRVIQEYQKSHSFIHSFTTEEKGAHAARNLGVLKAKGTWIAFLDSDDLMREDRLEKQLHDAKTQGAEVLGSWMAEFEKSPSHIVALKKVPNTHSQISKGFWWRNPVNHPTVFLKKECALRVGGYHHLHLMEDYEFWIRLYQSGAKFYNNQECLVLFRASQDYYQRRGGLSLWYSDILVQKALKKAGLSSWILSFFVIVVRLPVRLAPGILRRFIFLTWLRGRTS